mmetsp:Transcript_12031/g.16338  ORF Transcript_12031/g.16338 Transcript_12031/m.16338 type:complete len:264 (-) Transcript_12031:47-838(-)
MSCETKRDAKTSIWHSFAADLISASVTAIMVAPFITAIDRSVIKLTSGQLLSLRSGLSFELNHFLTRPLNFAHCQGFRVVCGLYFATYASANAVGTACEYLDWSPIIPKFLAVAIVNLPLSILQDRAFVRLFGRCTPRELPLATFGLFAARDAATMMASFSAPSLLANLLSTSPHTASQVEHAAQLVCPVGMQVASTPLHILGLDLYNNPAKAVNVRLAFMQKMYWRTTLARMGRIGPAFGIGGVGNDLIRKQCIATLEGQSL